jgi:hypothetical protein
MAVAHLKSSESKKERLTMFKSITLALLAAALFASCCKGNFNGQYAGTEITVYSGQQNVAVRTSLLC